MSTYISILIYPLIGWLLYIVFWLFSGKFIGSDIAEKFCHNYFYYFLAFFLCVIIVRCYQHSTNYLKSFISSFIFTYLWFEFVQVLILYSEFHLIHGTGDVIVAALSLLLDPLWQSIIAGLIATVLYIIVKRTAKFMKEKHPRTNSVA